MGRQHCFTLELRNDESLMDEYCRYHAPGNVWPEVIESIRAAGILKMRIYRGNAQIFMILEVDDSFTLEKKIAMDKENAAVQRWESLMEKFQNVSGIKSGSGKWAPVDPLFDLDDH